MIYPIALSMTASSTSDFFYISFQQPRDAEDKETIYIHAKDIFAFIHDDVLYLSLYCDNAVLVEVYR